AGASATYRYRALAAEHRWERWTVRTVVAAGAGVIAAGLSAWWAGLVVAALFICGHVAYVRLRPGSVASWRRGALAERRTGRRLARLDPAGFHVLHDRALPGGARPMANLDHLVIGLSGVYAIASRLFRVTARLRVEGRRILGGSRLLVGVSRLAVSAADVVVALLSGELGQEVGVAPLVVGHGARVSRDCVENRGVLFCTAKAIPRRIAREPVVNTSA